MKNSRLALLCITAFIIITLSGCGGGGGGATVTTDTSAPRIKNITAVGPNTSDGGDVVIQATVKDQSKLNTVYASIIKPDNTEETVIMYPTGNSVYSGTYDVPQNLSDAAAYYSGVIIAIDKKNHQAQSDVFVFNVPGTDSPPPPPDIPE